MYGGKFSPHKKNKYLPNLNNEVSVIIKRHKVIIMTKSVMRYQDNYDIKVKLFCHNDLVSHKYDF